MKHVFRSGSEIGHLWAHQTQDSARAGNVSFRGNAFVSYNTTVARIVTAPNGEHVYLLTQHSYSPSTRQHQLIARDAIPRGSHVFYVPVSKRTLGYPEVSADHSRNLEIWAADIKAAFAAFKAAKESKRSVLILEAVAMLQSARQYKEFFKVAYKLPSVPYTEAQLTIMTELAETTRQAAYDRVRAKLDARWTAQRLERERINALTQADRIKEWLAGENVSTLHDVPAMLRIKGENVETSKGANFPVSHARKGLLLVKAVLARGEAWQRNGHTCHLGHYQIDRIEANGTVHAGCHVVSYEAIDRISAALLAMPEFTDERQG